MRITKPGLVFIVCFLCLGFLTSPESVRAQGETVLAKIENSVITQRDLNDLMGRLAPSRRGKPFSHEEKVKLLQTLIGSVIIRKQAEKEKLQDAPEIRSRMKIEELELLVKEYIASRIQPSTPVEKEEIESYLKDRPQLFFPYTVRIREIMVQKEEDMRKVVEELRQGRDFSEVAKERSTSRHRIYGGAREIADVSEFPKPYIELLLQLKEGEISMPIKLVNDYIIIKLEERKLKPAAEAEKEKKRVMATAVEGLKREKMEDATAKELERLKKETEIEVYYDQIQ